MSEPAKDPAQKPPDAIEVPVGIVGVDLHREGRPLPPDAPGPWAENATLTHVGKPTPRLDAIEKVTGRARYTVDVQRKGMLYARILRSPHAHARVRSIDTRAAERLPGVKAIHVLGHVIGTAQEEGVKEANPPEVRYAGQPIAAVAAVSEAVAQAAVAKIQVDFEVLPHVVDPDDAQRPDAPLVFARPVSMAASAGGGGAGGAVVQRGNLRGPRSGSARERDPQAQREAVKKALQSPTLVKIERTYRTQVQTQSALEPHGLVAEWSGDELTVWASTQGLYSVADELAEVLDLKKSQIRVITDYCGGGFGAKFGAGNYGVLAVELARKAGAPVRLCLDRHEEQTSVGNRPASQQTVSVAAGKDGKLAALRVVGWGAGGAGAGAGFAGPAQNLYDCPSIYTEESDVFTHTGPLAAFRAPGHPQGAFALEQALDELAEALGLDPLELRERNDPHPVRREERRQGAAAFGWARRQRGGVADPQRPHVRRGVGMAQGLWYYLVNLNAHAEVRLHRDGGIELLTGVQDIGGGIRTPLAQVVAEELGVRPAEVRVSLGDSRLPPGPASGGSVTTASITPAARDAAAQAGRALLRELSAVLGVAPAELWLRGGQVGGPGLKAMSLREALRRMRKDTVVGAAERRADYGGFQRAGGGRGVGYGQLGGVQFAQVAVDTQTGVVQVERVVAAQDCGRPLNPLLVESQIHGGVIQGLSYALFEERRMDRRTGLMLNANLEQYKIAGAVDVPQIDVVLLEVLRGRSSTDASGIGEPATVPTAAAVANAVYNATGARVRQLPITPAAVLRALRDSKGGRPA